MAIGRENHISIESYANDRKHIAPSLFFIRHHVNYALRKRWSWAYYGPAAGYLFE